MSWFGLVGVFVATPPTLVEAASDHSCREGELGLLEGDTKLAGNKDGKGSGLWTWSSMKERNFV